MFYPCQIDRFGRRPILMAGFFWIKHGAFSYRFSVLRQPGCRTGRNANDPVIFVLHHDFCRDPGSGCLGSFTGNISDKSSRNANDHRHILPVCRIYLGHPNLSYVARLTRYGLLGLCRCNAFRILCGKWCLKRKTRPWKI